MRLNELLVVVPHSGIVVPGELPLDALSDRFNHLARNVDWFTNWLYDFRDILDNRHISFPYCNLVLEGNRHPEVLDAAVPLVDVYGEPVYRAGREPSLELRRLLVEKYLLPFHRSIESSIVTGAEFLLDGHSTVATRGMSDRQIDLMNFQESSLDDGRRVFSPDVYIETYAAELRKRLPDVEVTVNASEYHDVYGHVCGAHSVNAMRRIGKQVPAVLQETCEVLYRRPDGRVDVEAVNRLRRAFAESIHATLRHVHSLRRSQRMLDLHSQRQASDFDCGAQALQTVMAYYGVEVRRDRLIRELGTGQHGTDVRAMVAFARKKGFQVETGEGWTLDDVKGHVDQGHPVIVLVQAWSDRYMTLKEWRTNYEDGHYAIVIGYNDKAVFFEDSAAFYRTWLNNGEFQARWHDMDPATGRKLEQFGMVLLGRDPVGRVIEHMD
jgi:predicted double-glycine peptidase